MLNPSRVFMLALFSRTWACYLDNVDYKGDNLSQDGVRVEDAAGCQKLCQNNPACYFWSWASSDFYDPAYRGLCFPKGKDVYMEAAQGVISGPRDCGGGECCDEVEFETWGMADFYQEERMGKYRKIGTSASGRNVFKQNNGDNYLYYVETGSSRHWMIGYNVGVDKGGIMNRGDAICAEDSTQPWLFWMDWTESWEEDSDLEAKCNNGDGGDDDDDDNDNDGEDEPCATGNACEGCPIWSEVNGMRYCCANNCNSGSISVEEENGHVVCHCRH